MRKSANAVQEISFSYGGYMGAIGVNRPYLYELESASSA